MNWTELIRTQIETAYQVTDAMLDLVDEDSLNWAPATGDNWMTVGQLLRHIAVDACGSAMRGFVTGDWGMPPAEEMSGEDLLPPAEKFPAVTTVSEAKQLLADDKALALKMLSQCSEEDLATRQVTAPWNPNPMILGYRLLQMVDHLEKHKSQLFYYLKLQGKPVHTGNLWGM